VSHERLTNSKLNGLPLIIGGGDRGVVVLVPMKPERLCSLCNAYKMALRLCPQAKVMKGDMEYT
jgi:DNA polymerase-4